jgi:hypothetical protein
MKNYNVAETPEEFHQQQLAAHTENTRGEWGAKSRAFCDAIAPYVEQKAKIYNCCTSISVVVTNDGNIKHEYGLNEAQKTNLRLIDELIMNKRREIFNA